MKEVKNFTVKNILLNIKEMFEKYDQLSLENRVEVMKFVNIEAREIFDHIMYKYPQNSGSSATKRLKSRIPKIDNRESDEFDFLRNNGIDILWRESGDYSEDVMKVINKLISFSAETFDLRDEQKETNYEAFTEIMEYIFENAGTQPVAKVVENVVGIVSERSGLIENYQAVKTFANFAFHLGEDMAMHESVVVQPKEHASKEAKR